MSSGGGGGNFIKDSINFGPKLLGMDASKEFDTFMGDLTGRGAADAAGMAAMAQLQAARESRNLIKGESDRYESDLMRLAAATPEELRAQSQALAAGDRQLQADEKMLASIDPGLMEASQRALELMRGGPTAAGNYSPFEQARSAERAKLVDSLRSQYGPGAEGSSLGLKALRDFDLGSATQSAQFAMQNQQTQFGQASGLAGLFGQQRSGIDLQSRGANQLGIAGAFQNRLINARQAAGQSGLAAMSGTQAAVINAAGAPYVAQQARAQGVTSMYQGLMNSAIKGGMASMGGGGAAAKPMNEGGRVQEPSVWENIMSNITTGHAATNQTWDAGGVREQGVRDKKAREAKGAKGQSMSNGGVVRGQAPVAGDSPRNDVVAARLSPGEIVIPRTHARNPKKAKQFVDKLFKSEKGA